MGRINWLRVAVLVAVPLLWVLLFAYLDGRRQLHEMPPIGRALSAPERQEIEDANADDY